jgi:Domain of unknown function (DUF4190)
MTATPPEPPPERGTTPTPNPPPGTPAYGSEPTGYGFETPKTNGLAIASLVCGIIGCFWITAIVAIVLGFVARNQIEQSGGTQQGSGFALAGIILGFVWIGLGIIQFSFVLT